MEARRPPRPRPRQPDGLRKLSNENLLIIERHLLGEIPEKLRPRAPPPRPTDLALARPAPGLLSACLHIPDSPNSPHYSPTDSERSSETGSPLKKSFSFREKFSRLSFLGKHKDRSKIKAIAEDEHEKAEELVEEEPEKKPLYGSKGMQEQRASKRFWFFRQKEIERRERSLFSLNKRSKSFEFLPRAIEEEAEVPNYSTLQHNKLHSSQSFGFGSEAYLADPHCGDHTPPSFKFQDDDEDVFALHSIKESASETSKEHGSSVSTMTSTNSSGIHILQRGSVQDILDEFEKTVELFNENYTSDCETYTQTPSELSKKEKRKSSSFSTLPSPKVVQLNPFKPVVSEEFKQELSVVLSSRASASEVAGPRRGSVTDWFVLEERNDKYRRALTRPTARVRRVSSTKYVSNACHVYLDDVWNLIRFGRKICDFT
ncbi:unnamed protein product [Plutella xylostella]|uniref:(diamondback moth) hypothetical protein n=1 Tax=Plutella xylostella TaxID=51655 RepID=A0A8S4FGV0_PLUXY|nr:unnamed protein product [Plutella xylostella]